MKIKRIGSIILGVTVLYFGKIILKKAFGGDSNVPTLSSAPIKVEKPDLSNPLIAELENMKGSCYENISNYQITSGLNVLVPYPCNWGKSKLANPDPNVLFCYSAPTPDKVTAAIVVSILQNTQLYDADTYLKFIRKLPKTEIKDDLKISTLSSDKIKAMNRDAVVILQSRENEKSNMAVYQKKLLLFFGDKVVNITYLGGAQNMFWAKAMFNNNAMYFDSSIARLH